MQQTIWWLIAIAGAGIFGLIAWNAMRAPEPPPVALSAPRAEPPPPVLPADPELEVRSAGQKILMRMGAAHAGWIKAKLREIRTEIANRSAPAAKSGKT